MGRPVVHWELSGYVEAEFAGRRQLEVHVSSRPRVILLCHPERAKRVEGSPEV